MQILPALSHRSGDNDSQEEDAENVLVAESIIESSQQAAADEERISS